MRGPHNGGRSIDNFIRNLRRQRRSDPDAILESDLQIARFKQLLEDMSELFDPTSS